MNNKEIIVIGGISKYLCLYNCVAWRGLPVYPFPAVQSTRGHHTAWLLACAMTTSYMLRPRLEMTDEFQKSALNDLCGKVDAVYAEAVIQGLRLGTI